MPIKAAPEQQTKFVMATTEEEAHTRAKELEIEENTKLWANAVAKEELAKPEPRETYEVGEIETRSMNLKEKSDLLHNVATMAETDIQSEITTHKTSEDERRREILKQAENLDLQIMDIQKMKFSANELKDFTALSTENSEKTYQKPVVLSTVKAPAPLGKKTFFEELYDKIHH